MNKINLLISILFLSVIIFCSSCGEKYIYDKKYDITNQSWKYKDTLNFDFEIKDSMKIYNLYLEIAHTENYPFQNLYMMTYTKFPNGMRPSQLLNVELAEKTGKWQGEKSSDSWIQKVDLQKGAFFNQVGKYTLTLTQFMRQDSLPALKSIRFAIEETKQSRNEVDIKTEKKSSEKTKGNIDAQRNICLIGRH